MLSVIETLKTLFFPGFLYPKQPFPLEAIKLCSMQPLSLSYLIKQKSNYYQKYSYYLIGYSIVDCNPLNVVG